VYCNIDGFFWGFAMDYITFARQSYIETSESLVVVYESNENIET
jgi:hypothetical protein